jgi:UDP-N-acetylglucosamine 2-epimerase (non-hydrolysing)
MHYLIIYGTRPEFIKLYPLIKELRLSSKVTVVSTGQHTDLLNQAHTSFNYKPDISLTIENKGNLTNNLAEILKGLQSIFISFDRVVVHGDTLSTLGGALFAFFNNMQLIHIEAGLRSGDLKSPFPEEMNRILVSRIANYNFCPDDLAEFNLLNEGVSGNKIFVVGNTITDSLRLIKHKLKTNVLTNKMKIILVTMHRRENFNGLLIELCKSINELSQKYEVRFILHKNPEARLLIKENISPNKNIILLEALPYVEFINQIILADIILSDSGGVQEECAFLNKKLLIIRNTTERPIVLSDTIKICSDKSFDISNNVNLLLALKNKKNKFTKLGNGHVAKQIVKILSN